MSRGSPRRPRAPRAASRTASPSPGAPAPLAAARVLALGADRPSGDLAELLAATGCEVVAVKDAAALASVIKEGGFDAVVLDLSRPAARDLDLIEEAVAAARGMPGGARPFVLALTRDGKPPAQRGLRADLTASGRDAARAVQAMEAALSSRRLAAALSEIERLTRAVLHARKTAHDLAQPLTTILARSQMLLAKLDPQDPHRNAVSVICQESDRLAQIVTGFQQLRELARPQGRQES